MSRRLGERLAIELRAVRKDLKEELRHVTDDLLDWAPTPDMRSYRGQLMEIGATQAETAIALTEGRIPEWKESESQMTGTTVIEMVASLDGSLDRILSHLEGCDDDALRRTIEVPDSWMRMFGASQVEHEELVRWIARHEYYHLGQIVSYNWVRGLNPYKV